MYVQYDKTDYVIFDNIVWLALTGIVGIPVPAVRLGTNEQT